MTPIPFLISLSAVIISIVVVILYAKGIIRIPNIPKNSFTPYSQPNSVLPVIAPPHYNARPNPSIISPVTAPIKPPSKLPVSPSVPSSKPAIPPSHNKPPPNKPVIWNGMKISNDKDLFDKQARECTSHGGIFTGGNNDRFPGCDGHLCCKPNTPNWIDSKSVNVYHWSGQKLNTKDPFDKQARTCTENGGIYTGGNNEHYPGCDGHWCCARSK